MKKIDEITGKLRSKQLTLEQAKQQVSDLFDVSNSSDLAKELLNGCIVILETIDLINNNCS